MQSGKWVELVKGNSQSKTLMSSVILQALRMGFFFFPISPTFLNTFTY